MNLFHNSSRPPSLPFPFPFPFPPETPFQGLTLPLIIPPKNPSTTSAFHLKFDDELSSPNKGKTSCPFCSDSFPLPSFLWFPPVNPIISIASGNSRGLVMTKCMYSWYFFARGRTALM